MSEAKGKGRRIEAYELDAAKAISPADFLRRHFSDVKVSRNGRNISVKGQCRCDLKSSGIWLSCDWQGGKIGDNLQLVKHVTGADFISSIETLLGSVSYTPETAPARFIPPPPDKTNKRPKVPVRSENQERGLAYLMEERGISQRAIDFARRQGALRISDDGIAFLGRDWSNDGEIRYVAMRYYEQRVINRDGDIGNKKDLPYSSKGYPMVVGGEDNDVVLVEGGVNALALLDMMLRNGRCPLIMTTGGCGITQFVGTPHIQAILQDASDVFIYGENEKAATEEAREKKQANTDRLRGTVAMAIGELRDGEPARILYPPKEFDDAATYNKAMRVKRGLIAENPSQAPSPRTLSP